MLQLQVWVLSIVLLVGHKEQEEGVAAVHVLQVYEQAFHKIYLEPTQVAILLTLSSKYPSLHVQALLLFKVLLVGHVTHIEADEQVEHV